ncbi:2-octaprenyl-6-methoxyphenyl hydroxylase [Brucella melitensis]|nr:2-octaprenyl-6-methoxyphenyl hydroxylase [Brucella melitensis]
MAGQKNTDAPRNNDVVIAGGGYVGLVTAVAIKSAAPHLSVTVIDGAPAGAWKNDPRASSIAAAASRMLYKLGCWQEIVPEAQPITEMVITDSRTSDPVRPVFLTFEGRWNRANPSPIWSRTACSTPHCTTRRMRSASPSLKR